jgi:hypothetical protein
MEGIDHLIGLGKIIGNLHSLELLLRIFLCEAHGENVMFPKSPTGTVPETHLTNFMSLGDLITNYNAALTKAEQAYLVDPTVFRIRNAIAHGRLTFLSRTFPLTLHKFGKPKAGMAPVELVQVISEKWLDDSRVLIFERFEKISRCASARGYKSF